MYQYLICFVIFVIMAGFEVDNFSLSGLTQEGHELDVTVISSSSDDDNYDGLLDCKPGPSNFSIS